jgi:hypothetical protein
MAGMKLLTKLDPLTCLKLAWRTAQDQGYTITPIDDNSKHFTAKRGNVVVGLIAGPVSPYCCFEISVESYPSANELVLEKNNPWFTSGAIGVSRVNARATELFDGIAAAIEKEGGTIVERKEF